MGLWHGWDAADWLWFPTVTTFGHVHIFSTDSLITLFLSFFISVSFVVQGQEMHKLNTNMTTLQKMPRN